MNAGKRIRGLQAVLERKDVELENIKKECAVLRREWEASLDMVNRLLDDHRLLVQETKDSKSLADLAVELAYEFEEILVQIPKMGNETLGRQVVRALDNLSAEFKRACKSIVVLEKCEVDAAHELITCGADYPTCECDTPLDGYKGQRPNGTFVDLCGRCGGIR